METSKMSLKLLIDTSANKVLFAEGGKDFVDFLFSLLTLPVGAVIKLLTGSGRSMVSCIGNVYRSFEDLNEHYMQPNLSKDILLNPRVSISGTNFLRLTAISESTDSKKLYSCTACHSYVTNFHGTPCPGCSKGYLIDGSRATIPISRKVEYVGSSASQSDGEKAPNGYVQDFTYMVSDDLSVAPSSTISGISMLNKFNVSEINVLEERVVEFGTEEGLELLMASFRTKDVLTSVFLCKNEVGSNVHTREPSIFGSAQIGKTSSYFAKLREKLLALFHAFMS